jgi:hypothetical protein
MKWDIVQISYVILLDKNNGYVVGQLMFREHVYDMSESVTRISCELVDVMDQCSYTMPCHG